MSTPPRPDVEPAKSHKVRNWIIGAAVFLVAGPIVFDLAEEQAAVPAPLDAPAPVEPTFDVTAEMVVDVMPDATVDDFCTGYFGIGNYDLAFDAFAEGYGTDGPPYAAEVFDEVLSRC